VWRSNVHDVDVLEWGKEEARALVNAAHGVSKENIVGTVCSNGLFTSSNFVDELLRALDAA